MQKARVIFLCIAAAMVYGIVHDQITARICVEYFTLAHPRLFPVTSAAALGLCWGIASASGAGLLLGILLAQASQSIGLPATPISRLLGPIAIICGVTAIGATLSACIGFELSRRSIVTLPETWASVLSRSRQDRFMAVWFAHFASYFCGLGGGAFLIASIWNRRHRPRLLTLWPRSRWEMLRAGTLAALLGVAIWVRWFW
jgi:hypothetical protein